MTNTLACNCKSFIALGPVVNFVKPFSSSPARKASVFYLPKFFQAGLVFASKAGAYLSGGPHCASLLGNFQAFAVNISKVGKALPGTNLLAHFVYS